MNGSVAGPTISVITACFNCVETLQHTISSVAGQRGVRVRHLVIDGGSTDGSLDIIKSSPFISRFVAEPDNGMYDAMNKGVRLAEGDIVGILNADDFFASPLALQGVAEAFRNETVDACYGDLCYVDGKDSRKIIRYWCSGQYDYRNFYRGWMPPHPTFYVRKRVYERYGLFDPSFGSAADYELMLRFLLRHRLRVAYVPEILVCMRTGGVSNATLAGRTRANRMDRKAWVVNGLKPHPWTLWLKPLRKLPQYWRRPAASSLAADWLKSA